jgi:hypothetical protein
MLIATRGLRLTIQGLSFKLNLIWTFILFYCILFYFILFILIQFDFIILVCNLSYYTNMLVRNPL